MKYTDYLRIFLLFTNKEVKMKRIADLIQVNMRTSSGIKLLGCQNAVHICVLNLRFQ